MDGKRLREEDRPPYGFGSEYTMAAAAAPPPTAKGDPLTSRDSRGGNNGWALYHPLMLSFAVQP